ncbi:hypothetical protein AB0H43_27620 [Hamadaea sp. NPDC050747]|uniref:hypothetical protein n=1 Tax=Hamadaea sp. NPDC050747 TaxID=3155789 RepID=UPI0033F52448
MNELEATAAKPSYVKRKGLDSIMDALLVAMTASKGSLTAPPLAAAATVIAGDAAVPAMTVYADIMSASEWADGSQQVVAAAIEHLGAAPPPASPNLQRTMGGSRQPRPPARRGR